MGKEMLQGIDAERRLHILAVAHTAHGADVVTGQIGNILQLHGLEQCIVAFQEEGALQLYDGVHGLDHTLPTLRKSIYEDAATLHVFAREPYFFLHGLAQLLSLHVLVGLKHLRGIRTDYQRRRISAVQLHGDMAVLVCFYYEVGQYLMSYQHTLLSDRRARPWVQAFNLAFQFLQLDSREFQLALYVTPTLMQEIVVVFLHHLQHQALIRVLRVALNL